jgi:flavorubredoxin
MKPVKLRENIYWVGGIDWDLRNFHGYLTQRGSTYNAYLIIDEKITLIDTVKYYLYPELLERISAVVDPGKIDYIVSNHVEMDHSGAIPQLAKRLPNATIFTSPNGEKGLKAHFGAGLNLQVVKSGDVIHLGKRSLHPVLTQMVHWPDNMVNYLPEEKILFSNDAFGQHLASSERFDDEYPVNVVLAEAKKYYANIVLPYGTMVQKALNEAAQFEIEMIAPSHGIIWRAHIPEILAEYQKWSSNTTQPEALIIYDTMWGSTAKMAYAIANAFENRGIHTKMFHLQHNHISDVMTDLLTARYVCVGSPTLNNTMLPTMGGFLTYMSGLAPKGRVGMAFGSYGWGGQSIPQIETILRNSGFEMLKSIKANYIPGADLLKEITAQVEAAIGPVDEVQVEA